MQGVKSGWKMVLLTTMIQVKNTHVKPERMLDALPKMEMTQCGIKVQLIVKVSVQVEPIMLIVWVPSRQHRAIVVTAKMIDLLQTLPLLVATICQDKRKKYILIQRRERV